MSDAKREKATPNPKFRQLAFQMFLDALRAIKHADRSQENFHEVMNAVAAFVVFLFKEQSDQILFLEGVSKAWGFKFEAVPVTERVLEQIAADDETKKNVH